LTMWIRPRGLQVMKAAVISNSAAAAAPITQATRLPQGRFQQRSLGCGFGFHLGEALFDSVQLRLKGLGMAIECLLL